jgi:hypothetical protein
VGGGGWSIIWKTLDCPFTAIISRSLSS